MLPVPEPTEKEEELDVVSSCELLEDMEEGEIQDDTMEEQVVSQGESLIEQVQEDETAREEHKAQGKKMITSQEGLTNDNMRGLASNGILPAKEEKHLVRLKHGKLRDLRLPLSAQFDLNRSPARIHWLQQLFNYMNKIGSPILSSPSEPQLVRPGPESVMKALDLHLLYKAVKEEGGALACTANMGWKTIADKLFLPQQKAFLLKKMYDRYLLPFEENEVREMQQSVLVGMASNIGASVDNSGGRGQLLGGSGERGETFQYHGRGRGVKGERGRGKAGGRGRGEVGNHGSREVGHRGSGVMSSKKRRGLLGSPPKPARSPGQ